MFSREIGHIDQIVRFMRAETELIDPKLYANDDDWRATVADRFQRFRLISEHISQIRWLDNSGLERVRINIKNSQVETVPTAGLQDKAKRYYYVQGMQTPYGETLLTPIDLNIEHGQVVTPYEPTLRAVTKLKTTNGKVMGLLVLNYNLDSLLKRISALKTSRYTIELMNNHGHWLIAEEEGVAWQHAFGEYLNRFSNRYPKAWLTLKNNQDTRLFEVDLEGGRPASIQSNSVADGLHGHDVYYAVSQVRPSAWQSEWQYRAWVIVFITSITYALFGLLSYYYWRHLAQRRQYVAKVEQDKQRLEVMFQSLQQANKKLVSLQEELVEQSKMSALGMMVAGVGHELNTPLGGIRMSLSSLPHLLNRLSLDESEDLEVMRETLAIAEQNLTHAIEIVAQFKRITKQRMHQDKSHFDVHDMVEDVLAPLKQLLKSYPHITIHNRVASEQTWLAAPGVIGQVLQNLIMNALEHAFAQNELGVIQIMASVEDQYVIEVHDNGHGIPGELIDTIWEPFVTSGRSDKHTGLGLYMVYQWVHNLLDGTIHVQSSSEGTRFSIAIPIPNDLEHG